MHQVGLDEPMVEAQANAFFDQDLGKGKGKAIEQPEEKLASLVSENSPKESDEMVVDQDKKIAPAELEEKDEQAEVAKDHQSVASPAVTH